MLKYFTLLQFLSMHVIALLLLTIVNNWLLFFLGFLFWYTLSHTFGISIVYHKLFSHRSFVAKFWVAPLGTLICLTSFVGTPQRYALVHRIHHRHADTDLDPHTPKDHWYQGYFGIMYPDAVLSKFSEHQKRSVVNDLFEHFSWIRQLTLPLQLCVVVLFYLIIWYTGGISLLAAVIVASLASIHAGLAINYMGHRRGLVKNWPLAAVLLLAPSFNHQQHHTSTGDYNEAGVHGFDIGAMIIKHLLLEKTQ